MLNTLLANINDPVVIYIIHIVFSFGWLLSKGNELKTLKELFSKNRSEELKKAREELRDIEEEAEFYDEALRQEIFYTSVGIRCGKEKRRICQELVTNGIASVEGICRAYLYIYENNSKVEIKFSCFDKIAAVYFWIMLLLGIIGIYISIYIIRSNFNSFNFSNILFFFSVTALCIFMPLQQLQPMLFARAIRKRLQEREQESSSPSISPTEDSTSLVQEV